VVVLPRVAGGVALVLLSLVGAGPPTAVPRDVPERMWIPNGPVEALAVRGRTLFVGGDFTRIAPRTGSFVVLSEDGTRPDPAFPEFAGGSVSDIVSDDSGGWFVGGAFRRVGGVDCPRLAHVRGDGSLDERWCPRPNDSVSTLVRTASSLYVGGDFTAIAGATRAGAAELDAATGRASAWNPRVASPRMLVRAIAVGGSSVFLGAISPRRYATALLVEVDRRSGRRTAWKPPFSVDADSPYIPGVGALALGDGVLYVGGVGLAGMGGARRENLAALDLATAKATGWDPLRGAGAGHWVSDLTARGGEVYVSGEFSSLGGVRRLGLGAVDAVTGKATGWDPHVAGSRLRTRGVTYRTAHVNDIAIDGARVYLGGLLIGAGRSERLNAAAVDVAGGQALDWAPQPTDSVNAVGISGGRVAVGGSFASFGGVRRSSLGAIDVATGEPTSWDPRVGGAFPYVTALAAAGARVYVGGSFASVGGERRVGLAAVDAATGKPSRWNARLHGSGVGAVAVHGDRLYVGGAFDRAAGRPRSSVAAFGLTAGRLLPWRPPSLGAAVVDDIEVAGRTVYLASTFRAVGPARRWQAAAIDAVTGAVRPWNPRVGLGGLPRGSVRDLAVTPERVYLAGDFADAGGRAREGLAAVDRSSGDAVAWSARGKSARGLPDHPPGARRLVVSGDDLYVAGWFESLGGRSLHGAGVLDASTGKARSWRPELDDPADEILVTPERVYVGGRFRAVGGTAQSYLASFSRRR
jgi:hypothetical protein